MPDIQKLLNKRKWTGRELGILELTNMALSFKQLSEGREPVPLFSNEKLFKMRATITDPAQSRNYNGYIAVYEWIMLKYNVAQVQVQQAQRQQAAFVQFLADAHIAEEILGFSKQLPIIMTEKQYGEAKQKGGLPENTEIAVLTQNGTPEPDGNKSGTDENGHYIMPSVQNILNAIPLCVFFPESDKYAAYLRDLKITMESLLDSLFVLIGYNFALDIIADHYDVPEIPVYKVNIALFEKKVTDYNRMRKSLESTLLSADYLGEEELREKKLKTLNDFFPEIVWESLTISEENKRTAKNSLIDFQAFRVDSDDPLFALLFSRKKNIPANNGGFC